MSGFELGPFNEVSPPRRAVWLEDHEHVGLSEPFSAWSADLHACDGADDASWERATTVAVARPGKVSAVVYWVDAWMPTSPGTDDANATASAGANDDAAAAEPDFSAAPRSPAEGQSDATPLHSYHKWQVAFYVDELEVAEGDELVVRAEVGGAGVNDGLRFTVVKVDGAGAETPGGSVAARARPVLLDYHCPMLNVEVRNTAYDVAIARTVQRKLREANGRVGGGEGGEGGEGGGDATVRVLDIGSGSGLLGMMAARAASAVDGVGGVGGDAPAPGAAKLSVTCCEKVDALADISTEIIANSGFSDSVAVAKAHSSELDASPNGRSAVRGQPLPRFPPPTRTRVHARARPLFHHNMRDYFATCCNR